ncbi:MAG TPA: SulP family inorganic anion transporter [Polyangiaceae bacterium]|nr:SulP family inorganic anion transporter [Polyangiaceae bacterium]
MHVLRSVVPGERLNVGREILSSVVVFLVALPLCMGIAIACGVPPALGLITGIVAGLVVGALSGAPLQVSGPAAGLVVLVWEFIREFGIERLGVAVLFAGVLQFVAGALRLGRFLRAVSPAVIEGMLAGIGVLIFASQFHVMLDAKPRGSGVANLLAIPAALGQALTPATEQLQSRSAAWVALVTLGVLIAWNRLKPRALRNLPGSLMAVVAGTLVAVLFGLQVNRVQAPSNLWATVQLPSWSALLEPRVLVSAAAIAVIASAETLLSAAAVDKMHGGERANFDRELAAQGVGNILCGVLGALPMTGVIVRSSANVAAGARSRLSAMLHGFWLLLATTLLVSVLKLVPVAALASILVFTGFKLVNLTAVQRLRVAGRGEVLVYAVTLLAVVATDLLTGVLLGVAASVVKLALQTTSLELTHEQPGPDRVDLRLAGTATFLQLPKLAEALNKLPPGQVVHVHPEHLLFIDHACVELLKTWQQTYGASGGTGFVHWQRVRARGFPLHLLAPSEDT